MLEWSNNGMKITTSSVSFTVTKCSRKRIQENNDWCIPIKCLFFFFFFEGLHFPENFIWAYFNFKLYLSLYLSLMPKLDVIMKKKCRATHPVSDDGEEGPFEENDELFPPRGGEGARDVVHTLIVRPQKGVLGSRGDAELGLPGGRIIKTARRSRGPRGTCPTAPHGADYFVAVGQGDVESCVTITHFCGALKNTSHH